MSVQAAKEQLAFSSVTTPVTLTTDFVASDASIIKEVKTLTFYLEYTRGSGAGANVLTYLVEFSPDDTGSTWYKYGTFINTSGVWNEEPATFTTDAGTALAVQYITPMTLININARRVRVSVKETQSVAAAGTAKVFISKNTIN